MCVSFYLGTCFSFSLRHTNPLPESLFQRVKDQMLGGDLTDEEEVSYR